MNDLDDDLGIAILKVAAAAVILLGSAVLLFWLRWIL